MVIPNYCKTILMILRNFFYSEVNNEIYTVYMSVRIVCKRSLVNIYPYISIQIHSR